MLCSIYLFNKTFEEIFEQFENKRSKLELYICSIFYKNLELFFKTLKIIPELDIDT